MRDALNHEQQALASRGVADMDRCLQPYAVLAGPRN